MPTPSAAQQRAITTHDANLIVTAGAGSGKTFVLVERYLALLARHPEWRLDEVVAITFTEKAAREMRNRIREVVARLAAEGQAPWPTRLLQLEQSRISTIHSFCATLLRGNAAEAALDPDFRVLDEVEARLLMEEAAHEALLALAESDDPAVALLLHEEPMRLHRLLVEFLGQGESARLALARLPEHPDGIIAWWEAELEALRADALTALATDQGWQAAAAIVRAITPLDPADKLAPMHWLALTAIDAIDECGPGDEPAALVALAGAEAIKLNVGSAAQWGGKAALADLKTALGLIRERAKAIRAAYPLPLGPDDLWAAEALVHWRTLLQAAIRGYEGRKARRDALDFDDLEARTRRLLRDHPELCLREQRAIRHLLVDEFQDINQAQSEIIQALAGEVPGRLFVVGDGKQSIYRFRGALVEIFRAFSEGQAGGGGSAQVIELAESYRAHHPLVEASNALFRCLFDQDGAAQVRFDPLIANRLIAPTPDPALEVILVPYKQGDDDPDTDHRRRERRWEAWAIASRLRQWVEEGRPVVDRESGMARPFAWGDAAILFRAMSDVTIYEEVLKAQGIPYVTLAGRGFYGRQEVQDLLNLLGAIASADGSEDLPLAAVLRSPLVGLSDEGLLWLARHRTKGSPLFTTLAAPPPTLAPDDAAAVARAERLLRGLREQVGRLPVLALLRQALAETGYLATLTALPDGERRRGNVEKLLDLARTRGSVMLSDFNRYVDDLRAHEIRESEALVATEGAVQLMTIHAAKGLEFPVVILADASRTGRAGAAPLLHSPDRGVAIRLRDPESGDTIEPAFYQVLKREQQEAERCEATRLLYVAATRARDLLVISGRLGSGGRGSWLARLIEALALQAEPPDESPISHFDYAGTPVRLWYLREWPAALDLTAPPTDARPSMLAELAQGYAIPALPPQRPPLLDPLPSPLASHPLAATRLNGLHAEGRLAALPTAVSAQPWSRVSGWQVGTLATAALLRWHLPAKTPQLAALLRSLAWQHGLTEHALADEAAERALSLLRSVERSPFLQEMAHSRQRHLALPYTLLWRGRPVSGQLDALFQRPDGYWTLVAFRPQPFSAELRELPEEELLAALIQAHGPAMAMGQQAAREVLGTRPNAVLFPLFAARPYFFPAEAMAALLDQLETQTLP